MELIKSPRLSLDLKTPALLIVALAFLYLSSLYNYLLFHSLVEMVCIITGVCMFIIASNARTRLENNYLLVLGVSAMFTGSLDLVHTLAYKGMNIFPGFDANLPTQLWLAARYLQAGTLLATPFVMHIRPSLYALLVVYAAITLTLFVTIFSRVFPVAYIEGSGLTRFKIVSEYIISGMFAASIASLYYKRDHFEKRVLRWLMGSLFFSIGAELAFTSYISVYGLSNLVGHLLRLVAAVLAYIAIVETGLKRPEEVLYVKMKQNELALQKALEEVSRLANTDGLTGIFNRRHFSDLAEVELSRSKRYGHPLSVIMIDIDNFKKLNDELGHVIGDQILQQIARCCNEELRASDIMARFGGDEFIILLPNTAIDQARQVAERMKINVNTCKARDVFVTVVIQISQGITQLSTRDTSIDSLLSRADKALYQSKLAGRNQYQILLDE